MDEGSGGIEVGVQFSYIESRSRKKRAKQVIDYTMINTINWSQVMKTFVTLPSYHSKV